MVNTNMRSHMAVSNKMLYPKPSNSFSSKEDGINLAFLIFSLINEIFYLNNDGATLIFGFSLIHAVLILNNSRLISASHLNFS